MKYFLLSLLLISSLSISYTANSVEGAFDETNDLSEQDEINAKEYFHQGLMEDAMKKNCDPSDPEKFALCNDGDSLKKKDKWMSQINNYLPIVSKAYGLFGNALKLKKITKAEKGSQGGKYVSKNGTKENPNTDTKKDAKKEDQQDYCAMIAGVGEMVTTVSQGLTEAKIKENYDKSKDNEGQETSQQAEAIYAVAQTHEARSKTARNQALVWGSSAACYGVMLATGQAMGNTTLYVKMGAAAALTTFYGMYSKAQKDRAEEVKKVADSLPKAGTCNPFTNTSCFCANDSSKEKDPANYERFCVPDPYKGKTAEVVVSCINDKSQIDNECKCKKTKSCISTSLSGAMGNLAFGTNSTIDPLSALRGLENGMSGAQLASETNRNLAFAKKMLNEKKPKDPGDLTLTKEQKELAKVISDSGIPKLAAALLAKSPSADLNTIASFSRKPEMPSSYKSTSAPKAASYNSNGSSNTRRKTKSDDSGYNPFAKFNKKAEASKSAIEIEDYEAYAEKAYQAADITKDTSKPIFEIITYRYKLSAWKRFEDQMNKETLEVEENK